MVNIDLKGYDPNAAQSLFKPDSEPTPTQTTTEPAKTEPAPAETTQTLVDKPEVVKDDKPKSRLEKIGQVKKPEEKKVEPKVEEKGESQPEPKTPPELRNAYNLSKKEAAELRAELEKVKPDYEKIRVDYDLTKKELAELKALNLNPEERKTFDSLRELHARYELEQKPDYQEKILAPIQRHLKKLEKVATDAKLGPVATEALKNAMDIEDEIDRGREIRRIFKEADLEQDDFNDFYTSMVGVGKELNERLYPEMDKAQKNAIGVEQAARTRQKQEAEQAQIKEKAEFQKEKEYVTNLLKSDKLKIIFDDTDLSVDGTTLEQAIAQAEPADNPRDRALEVQSAAVMPFMIEYLNKLLAENHQLHEGNRARNGSGPKITDAQVKTPDTKGPQLDADAIFKNPASFGMR